MKSYKKRHPMTILEDEVSTTMSVPERKDVRMVVYFLSDDPNLGPKETKSSNDWLSNLSPLCKPNPLKEETPDEKQNIQQPQAVAQRSPSPIWGDEPLIPTPCTDLISFSGDTTDSTETANSECSDESCDEDLTSTDEVDFHVADDTTMAGGKSSQTVVNIVMKPVVQITHVNDDHAITEISQSIQVNNNKNNLHKQKKCSETKKPRRRLPKLPVKKAKKNEESVEDEPITKQDCEVQTEVQTEEPVPKQPEDDEDTIEEVKPSYTWNLVHAIETFKGEHEEMSHIHESFPEKVLALTGCAGSGKTEMVRKYCEEYASCYDTIIWVNSERIEQMKSNFFDLAKDLEVYPPGTFESLQSIEDVVSDVYKTLSSKKSLFVFDNVTNIETLEKFLPNNSHTNIKCLTTSTETLASNKIQPFTVNVFTNTSACTFVSEHITEGIFNEVEANRLINIVEKHPLLIQLCISYINKHNISIKEYIYSLETYLLTLIHETFHAKYGKLITAAINLSMQGLIESNSESQAQFLNMLTVLDITKMETSLLRHVQMLSANKKDENGDHSDFEHIYDGDYSDFRHGGEKTAGDKDNGDKVERFLTGLQEYSFITRRSCLSHEDETFYTMHEAIKEAIQNNMKESDITNCISFMSKMIKGFTLSAKIQHGAPNSKQWLHHLIPLIRKYSTNEDIMEIMSEHKADLVSCLEKERKDNTLNEIVSLFVVHELAAEFKCGQGSMRENKFDNALSTFEALYKKQTELLGGGHVTTLDTMFHTGVCLTEKKDYRKAFLKFEELLENDKEHAGTIHVKTLDAIHEIGYCYMDKQDYQQALEIFQKAMDKEEEHLGEHHVGTLNTMYNIGSCHMQLANIEEALDIFKLLHDKEKQHFGNNHVNSLDTMHLIGHCYMKHAQYDEALAYFERVFQQRKELFGFDHVDTLTAMYNVGSCLMKQLKFEDAIKQLEDVMQKRKEKLGEEHTDTLIAMFNIGYCLMQINKYEQAIAMFQEVHKIRNKILGATHVNTLNTRISIGECLMFQGEYDAALVIFEEVLEKRRQVLGEDHISTLDTRHLIGHCYMKQNKYDKALLMLDKVLGMQKKHLGEDHANTLMTLSTIGRCYMQQSDNDKALTALEKVLQQQKQKFGENHKKTIGTMKEIGRFLKDHSNFEEALPMYEKVLEKERKHLGENHVDTLNTMNEIGHCLMQQLEQSKCDRALEIFEEIVEKLKEHLGHSHVNTLSAMQSFGLCFLQQSEFKSALNIFEQLVDKQTNIFGENHAKTISTRERIRECKKALWP